MHELVEDMYGKAHFERLQAHISSCHNRHAYAQPQQLSENGTLRNTASISVEALSNRFTCGQVIECFVKVVPTRP